MMIVLFLFLFLFLFLLAVVAPPGFRFLPSWFGANFSAHLAEFSLRERLVTTYKQSQEAYRYDRILDPQSRNRSCSIPHFNILVSSDRFCMRRA